jgi:hypothetical protein
MARSIVQQWALVSASLICAPLLAQEDCNALFPAGIQYSPFESGLIEVRMVNTGAMGWSYPSLVLYNNNDTIAWAPAEYFALGSEQVFSLPVVGNVVVPNGGFYGKLELWTGFNDSLRCTWYPEPVLCHPAECTTVHPYVLVNAPDAGGMQFTWNVMDDQGQVVANGEMVVPMGHVDVMDTVCLPPGDYSLSVFDPWVTGENVYFQMRGQAWNTTASQQIQLSTGATSDFHLMQACANEGNGMQEAHLNELQLHYADGELIIGTPTAFALDHVQVIDVMGRTVADRRLSTHQRVLRLPATAHGILLVYAHGSDQRTMSGRIYVP